MINDQCSMINEHWLIPKERNNNNWKRDHPVMEGLFLLLQLPISSAHRLLLTVACISIGRFANRPYNRTQQPSYQYREPLLTLHSSLFAFHCSSPLWKTYFLKKTKKHVKVKRKNVSLSLQNKANTIQIIITKKWYKKSLVSGCF